MPISVANAVSKQLGRVQAVENASLSVQAGRAFGLLGPNGAGKTTMVRLLTGILSPDDGHIELFGERLWPGSDHLRKRVGVQTDTNVYELLTTEQNLQIWGDLYGIPSNALQSRITELLTQFDLLDKRGEKAGSLSKGMRQKLSVARALLHRPELLFLDEPTAGLDPAASDDLILHLRNLIHQGETTVVICTHQLRGLETLVDDLGFIYRGNIVSSGTVDELLAHRWPGARYSVRFAGPETVVAGLIAGRYEHNVSAGAANITFPDEDAAADFLRELTQQAVRVFSFTKHEPTIHELYLDTVSEQA